MAKAPTQAVWTQVDEETLIEYLFQHRAAAGDGSSFKITTFNGVVDLLEAMRTRGGHKTAKSIQNKWTMVRNMFYFGYFLLIPFSHQLRRIWRVIQDIKAQSGWSWSDIHGANITPAMETNWEIFLRSHPLAKPFKNHGWIHLEKMTQIMPATLRGTYVYVASHGTTGLAAGGDLAAPQAAGSPDWASWSDAENDQPENDPLGVLVSTVVYLLYLS